MGTEVGPFFLFGASDGVALGDFVGTAVVGLNVGRLVGIFVFS